MSQQRVRVARVRVARVRVAYGGELDDRTRRLYSGEVRPVGVDFRYLHLGLDENRAALNVLCRYGFEQGFTRRLLQPEELFVPSTVSSAKM